MLKLPNRQLSIAFSALTADGDAIKSTVSLGKANFVDAEILIIVGGWLTVLRSSVWHANDNPDKIIIIKTGSLLIALMFQVFQQGDLKLLKIQT